MRRAGCETGPRSSCFMPKPSTACQHLVPFRQPLLLLGAAPCTGVLQAPNRGDFSPAPPHSPLRAAPCLCGYREGNQGGSTPRTACFCLCLTSVIPSRAHEIPPNTPRSSQVPGATLCWCSGCPAPPAPSSQHRFGDGCEPRAVPTASRPGKLQQQLPSLLC